MDHKIAQPTPLHDLTAFQRDILVAIRDLGQPKGLAVKAQIEAVYEVDEINHGRLYPNLDQLVEKGLVSKSERDQRTNEYALTDRGRRELETDHEWRCNGGAE